MHQGCVMLEAQLQNTTQARQTSAQLPITPAGPNISPIRPAHAAPGPGCHALKRRRVRGLILRLIAQCVQHGARASVDIPVKHRASAGGMLSIRCNVINRTIQDTRQYLYKLTPSDGGGEAVLQARWDNYCCRA